MAVWMMCTQDCLKRKCLSLYKKASQVAPVVKKLTANTGDTRNMGLNPVLGRVPEEGNGNPLQLFLLRESHGQRSLAGYSPWGRKESGTTEMT